MKIISTGLLTTACLLATSCGNVKKEKPGLPNIIYILSDDLSWGDIGAYGQELIKTPNIDRIANEGIRFTNAYAGSSVCAPSRSALMQGKHMGHATVRDNMYMKYRHSLQEEDFTVAMMLQEAGYKTGLFGKWGLAVHDQPGIPNNKGFDEFFGYLNQQQAHTYYPEFLWKNKERVYYPENLNHHLIENYKTTSEYDDQGRVKPNGITGDPYKAKYSFDEYCQESLEFVRNSKDSPFFLYLAYTIPHGALIVPELGIYKDMDWPMKFREWAAMITRMDSEVGKLLKLLDELGLDDNTLIFFSSDNGLASKGYIGKEGTEFFKLAGPTSGEKGNAFDGSFRVPAMVRWPGIIKPGQVSDHIWAFWDFLPTVADIIGVEPPEDTDGISLLPTLLDTGNQQEHEYLYWEHNQRQAVRKGNWYAYLPAGGKIQLFDLDSDPQQKNDLSVLHPEIVKRMEEIMAEEYIPSDAFPKPGESRNEFLERLKNKNIPEWPENVEKY